MENLHVTLSNEERKGFEKVIEKIFEPAIKECGKELDILLQSDSEIKEKVEEKLQRILKNREEVSAE